MTLFNDEKKLLESQLKEEIGKFVVFLILLIPCIMFEIYLKCLYGFRDTRYIMIEFIFIASVVIFYLRYRPSYKKCFAENYRVVECRYRFKRTDNKKYYIYLTNVGDDSDTSIDNSDFICFKHNTEYKGDLYYRIDNESVFNNINELFTFRIIVYKTERMIIDSYLEKPVKSGYYSCEYIKV